ncbi:hypothetical protein E1287_07550 [Actinomadura sp. KC06]|uniref:hypothetical protein n=1 Tax=Actinomadura sp. KC06 TaxID=2530369 RepID=UPI00104D68E2|nr:hypothetical protein [Actinomadura sp. KC06]TDD37903.1 hypothetical protein E1287_07550 [Actinomadura sp. KC06]
MPASFHQLRSGVWTPLGDVGPSPTTMLVGAANTIPNSNESGWLTYAATVPGPQTVRRTYSSEAAGVPSSWAVTGAGSDVGKRASVWSFKPNITQMASGALDAQVTNLISSIPDTHVAMLALWAEADRHVRLGAFTAAQWRAAHTRFASIVRAVGKPRVWIYLSHTSYLWDPINTRGPAPEDVWPGDGQVDIYGQDGYGYATWPDPETLFGGGLAEARSRNVPWGIFESGADEHPSDATRKSNWMTSVADWAATQGSGGRPGCEALVWFNSAVGLDEDAFGPATPSSSPQALAAAGAIATTYYRDWATYTL